MNGVYGMDVNIPDEELERLTSDQSFTGGYSEHVVDMFRQTLQIVAAVPDESVLDEFECLRYRKMRGRGSRRRLALTEDTDLVVKIQNGRSKPKVIVERISHNGRKKK